jgi:hypothetical protein
MGNVYGFFDPSVKVGENPFAGKDEGDLSDTPQPPITKRRKLAPVPTQPVADDTQGQQVDPLSETQYPLKEACRKLGLKPQMLKRLAEGIPGLSKVKIGPKQAHFHWTFSESCLRVILNQMQGGFYVPKKEPARETGSSSKNIRQISRL